MKLDTVMLGFGLVGAAVSKYVGGWDLLIQYLILFVVIDYVTGMVRSGMQGKLSSKIGWAGIAKKVGIFVIVIIAQGVDRLLAESGANFFNIEMPVLRTVIIWAYIINEITSILENVKDMGVPVPPALEKVLGMIRDRNETKQEGENK